MSIFRDSEKGLSFAGIFVVLICAFLVLCFYIVGIILGLLILFFFVRVGKIEHFLQSYITTNIFGCVFENKWILLPVALAGGLYFLPFFLDVDFGTSLWYKAKEIAIVEPHFLVEYSPKNRNHLMAYLGGGLGFFIFALVVISRKPKENYRVRDGKKSPLRELFILLGMVLVVGFILYTLPISIESENIFSVPLNFLLKFCLWYLVSICFQLALENKGRL